METFDRLQWGHEQQAQSGDDDDIASLTLDKPTKTDAQRQAENEARQRRGDRQDWRQHLRPLPKGYYFPPERSLTKVQKIARSKSIKRAIAKREERRATGGIPHDGGQAFRQARHAELVEREQQRTAERDAVTVYGPYDLVGGDTRAWEAALQQALEWFVETFSGEPEHPSDRHWREYLEGHKRFISDVRFGYGGVDWDWTYEVPDRDDPQHHGKRNWSSPHLPPSVERAALAARAAAL